MHRDEPNSGNHIFKLQNRLVFKAKPNHGGSLLQIHCPNIWFGAGTSAWHTGLSPRQHREFYFHSSCSARTGSDQKGSKPGVDSTQNRQQSSGKGQFPGMLPLLKSILPRGSQYSTERVLAQSKLQGFSTLPLQACDGCESQLLPRERGVSRAIPGLLHQLQDQLLFTQLLWPKIDTSRRDF